MAIIKVYTDSGKLVETINVADTHSGWVKGAAIFGRRETPEGWLGRALRDAYIIEQGGDPERPSEKAMRLLAEKRRRDELQESSTE